MHVRPAATRPFTAVMVTLLSATGVAGCQGGPEPGPVAAVAHEAPALTEVVEVVGPGTLEVRRGDTSEIVSLLGVAAPGTEECLGNESAEALSEILPAGTEVRLDPVGSPDTAVVWAGDLLINAELVRRGLALASPDVRPAISEEIAEAQTEAVEAQAGVFGTQADCTLPAQVAALEQAETEAASAAAALALGVGLDEIDRHGVALATVTATGAALLALLDGDASRHYPSSFLADLRARTQVSSDHLTAATAGIGEVRAAEEQWIEAERVAAEAAAQAAEAARVAQAAAGAEAARAAAAAEEAAAAAASVYYPNCSAVRAAGAAPIYAGEPGYSRKLDRDGDGVACEN